MSKDTNNHDLNKDNYLKPTKNLKFNLIELFDVEASNESIVTIKNNLSIILNSNRHLFVTGAKILQDSEKAKKNEKLFAKIMDRLGCIGTDLFNERKTLKLIAEFYSLNNNQSIKYTKTQITKPVRSMILLLIKKEQFLLAFLEKHNLFSILNMNSRQVDFLMRGVIVSFFLLKKFPLSHGDQDVSVCKIYNLIFRPGLVSSNTSPENHLKALNTVMLFLFELDILEDRTFTLPDPFLKDNYLKIPVTGPDIQILDENIDILLIRLRMASIPLIDDLYK
jgi:hypothetical protein